MKKKIIALVTVLLMVLSLFPMVALAADGSITADGTYALSDYGNDSTITIGAGLTVTLQGDAATTYTSVYIVCGAGVKLTLSNVKIDNLAIPPPVPAALTFTGTGNTLTLAGESTLRNGGYQPGVRVSGGTELTIDGDGKLYAHSAGGAAIGGAGNPGYITCPDDSTVGAITINGGTIRVGTANGSAGIGGGYNSSGGHVTVNSGTITGYGTFDGAGIGDGQKGSGCHVVINGGTVTVTSGSTVWVTARA